MTSPKHLWSGDWEHESRLAQSGRPSPPPPPDEPPLQTPDEPPGQRPGGLRSRTVVLTVVAVLALAGVVWAITSSGSNTRTTTQTNSAAASTTGTATAPTGFGQTGTNPTTPTNPTTGAQADALGLQLALVPVNRVIVQAVEPGSAAAQVGIGAGDLLLSINGRQVTSPDQANGIIARLPRGSLVRLDLVQGNAQIQATIQESNGP